MNNVDITILEPKDLINQLNVIDLSEFLSLDLPPRELILSPWLPRAGLCMIHAYRGVGKTHLSLGIAYAVAAGGGFLTWKAEKPRGVLYIDGEMPAVVLQDRLKNIVLMNGNLTLQSRLRIITPDLQSGGIPDLATTEGQEIIEQYINDDIELIIIDNISCLASSIKENDANDWVALQTWILRQRSKGKSVLLIHHAGKSGKQRGTSRKEDVLDTVMNLHRPDDYKSDQGARFVVRYEKNRGFYGDDAKSFECQLLVHENGIFYWKTQPLEESTYEKIISLNKDGLSQKEISEVLDIHKSTVSKNITRAKLEGLITA